MKNLISLMFLVASSLLYGQQSVTITPQVINSAGGHREAVGTGVWITDNVGEPFTETISSNNVMITQGFVQPPAMDGVRIEFNGLTCMNRDDGIISVSYSSLNQNHSEAYFWSPADACPTNNCNNKVTNLKPGSYSVTIVSTYTTNNGTVKTDTVRRGPIDIVNSLERCRVVIYSGVTANSDGNNDTWNIENITEFPDNHVSIYSRWGTLIYDVKGYDNINKFWPNQDMLNRLIPSTYFYVVELGDGSKPIKGWVELMKN